MWLSVALQVYGLLAKLLASFGMDFDGVLDFAAEMFNGLWPIFKIPLGLILAFGILFLVYNMVKNSLHDIKA